MPKLQTRIPNRPVTDKFETTRSILHATPTEIWGDVTYMGTWTEGNTAEGYYTFTPENPIAFNLKHTIDESFEGAAFVNGKIYGSYILQSFYGAEPFLIVYDPETGESSTEYMSDFKLMATETAQGADGTVYGQFYNAEGSALEYGVIDYEAKTRTTIGTATNPMVAMGVTNDNKLYGIATNGNLYQISIENGTETLIGSTGLAISDADGRYYGQTGEIDPKTNIFYWAEISTDATVGFYTVDLTNATPVKIADYAEGVAQVRGMLIPPPEAEDKSPAAATELEANFVREATTGSFEFKAPAKTFDGTENLSGQLGYKVFINGEEKKSGTCNPSSYVSETVTVPEGMNNFVVTVSNAVGNGAKAKLNKWVGFDIPKPATGVTLTANNETGKIDLTWTAPTEGMNGGYMGALKYNVYRIVNGTETQVATAQEGTSFTETVTVGQMTTYSYAVEAVNGTKTGAKATSNGTVIGSAFEVPYFEDFLTADAAGIYTILDANSDGMTWTYDKNNHSMYNRYSFENNADDWLFTPPIKLKAGKTYQFSVNAKAKLKSFPERFEVKLGTGTTAEAMNIDVIGSTDLLVASYETFTNDNITVPVDGEYNFGIHAISDADKFQIYIDSVTVEIGPAPTAPAAPEITATPGAAGAMKADLSIKAPAKAINGSALSENMTIKIKRDGTEIHTLTGVAPDATVTYTDNDANLTAGYHEYVAIPYNSSDIGRKSNKARVYIGLDTPKKPENAKATDNQSAVALSWDAVTAGVNNGYVDPSGVKYNIRNVVQGAYGLDLGDKITDTDQTNFDVTYNCDEGEQDFKYWAVNAFNTTGESGYSLAYLIAGAPYTLPMKESFADKKLSYFWMYRDPVLLKYSTDASDNDGFAMSMVSTQSNVEGAFGSGKISLAGTTKPTLVFSHKSTSTANTLKVVAVKPDGTTTDVQGITVSKEYAMAKVDLTPYVGERYIRLEFTGGFTEPGTFTFDNINILDMLEHNVVTDMTAPKDMKKGQTKDVKVKVSNRGANTASGVSLRVSADDKVFYDKPVADIPSMESVEVAVPYTASVFLTGNSVNLKAEAVYALDLDPDDNVSTATISVEASTVNPPADLTGAQNGDATVTLNWTAPSAAPLDVTENFDSYAPWAIEFGEWTLVDGNPNATTGGFFQSYQYGSQGTPFAFTIMNPNDIFPDCLENNPNMTPHSGDQYAMAVYKFIGQDFQNGDEWIISPQLPGIGQTISFFTLNLTADQDYVETFDILYSTTDNDIASFTKIGDTRSTSGGAWQEFSVDLPEGTRHFAIHHNTNGSNAFLFGLDDITYKTGASEATGYNIYMDGELIGTVSGGNVVTFTADPPSPDGEHTYSVTALYADGSESVPVSITLTTAIDEIFSEGKAHDIYTLDGILVRKQATSADGLKKGVYVIDNKAVVIK